MHAVGWAVADAASLWSHEDDVEMASQRASIAHVRAEVQERAAILARLPESWEEHWQLADHEYTRYYLNVQTGEVSREPPQLPDTGDRYECQDLEGALGALLRAKRGAGGTDSDDAELGVQLAQLLKAYRSSSTYRPLKPWTVCRPIRSVATHARGPGTQRPTRTAPPRHASRAARRAPRATAIR